MIEIRPGDLADQHVVRLLRHHFDKCHEVTPPGSTHVFDATRLKAANIDFWAAWDADELLGVGAVQYLDPEHGEVKSMHTAQAARRRGVGAAILRHIINTAKAKGVKRLSLETGSFEFFRPAVLLYQAHGFRECEPFGGYRPDPNSVFLTRSI